MIKKPIAECQAVQTGPTKCMYYGSKQEAAGGEAASSAATPSPLKQFQTSSSTSSKLLYMLFMYRYLFLWTILWYLVNNFYIKLTLNCLSNGSSSCSISASSRKKQVCCYDDGYVCSASNKMSAKQKNTSYFYRNRNYRYRYNKIIYNWKEITRRTSYKTGPQQSVKL